MILWRPVSKAELQQIEKSGWREFPSRLTGKPIFYPVLRFPYADEIACDWDTTPDGHCCEGFVTEFEMDDSYLSRIRADALCALNQSELWVPTEQLDEFNSHIIGKIDVVATYSKAGQAEQ